MNLNDLIAHKSCQDKIAALRAIVDAQNATIDELLAQIEMLKKARSYEVPLYEVEAMMKVK